MIDMGKYKRLLSDLRMKDCGESWDLYKRYKLWLLDDYSLCKRLMRKKGYEKEINKLRKMNGMFENGMMDYGIITKLNLQYKVNLYDKGEKDGEEESEGV